MWLCVYVTMRTASSFLTQLISFCVRNELPVQNTQKLGVEWGPMGSLLGATYGGDECIQSDVQHVLHHEGATFQNVFRWMFFQGFLRFKGLQEAHKYHTHGFGHSRGQIDFSKHCKTSMFKFSEISKWHSILRFSNLVFRFARTVCYALQNFQTISHE